MTGLPADQQETLEVLVTTAAWAYHQGLGDDVRVDAQRASRVHGDLRLVAADVLTAAATAAQRAAAGASGGQVKRFKIDGEYEEEYFASTSSASGDAETWATLAASLRAEVAAERRRGTRRGSRSTAVEVSF